MCPFVILYFFACFLLKTADLHEGISSDSSSASSSNTENIGGEQCSISKPANPQEKLIACYFPNWTWNRSGLAKFTPENINASFCTHIIYAFASLDNSTLTIVSSSPRADIQNKLYESVTALKDYGVKVLIAIGGWNNSAGNRWSRLISNSTARKAFVSSVIAFLEEYNFDGLDMDYEYPGCPQGKRTAGLPTDIDNFNRLLAELKTAFHGKYLLTAATSGGKRTIDTCYNMTELCRLVDWVNVMSYQSHSYRKGETGAKAPLHGTKSSWGVIDTVKYYIDELQCSSHKIVLGIPFYGNTFTMVNTAPAQFGVPVSGPGTAGTYTKSSGILTYYEICLLIKNGYSSGHSRVNGSYAWNGTQFISYDGPIDIIKKSRLIMDYGLKGAMLWNLAYDDFNSTCGGGRYPLLTTLNQQLRFHNSSTVAC